MAMMKYEECGHEISDKAEIFPNCGYRIPKNEVAEKGMEATKNEDGWIMGSSAQKPIVKKEKKKVNKKVIAGIAIFFLLCALIDSCVGSDTEQETNGTEVTNQSEEQPQEKTGEKIEKAKEEKIKIEDFSYEIKDDKILLKSYNSNNETLEIKSSYEIDGKKYKTDLSEFVAGSGQGKTRKIIFPKGTNNLYTAVFNSCDANKIYFPKSMKTIYDYTLSYLQSGNDGKIQIYYAGTKKQWKKIFKKYKRKTLSEAESPEEKGTAIADKINEMMGDGYDGDRFEYFFEAKPEDLK